jgi:sugar O-acyltransferase (sialic acid O-acetyltransferase NeuD family)
MGMDRHPLLIVGAGGHAKVVIDIVEREGLHNIVGLLDDNPDLHGQLFFGYQVLGGQEIIHQAELSDVKYLVAIGVNHIRKSVGDELTAEGLTFLHAIHPSAQISRGVTLGHGTVVMAGTVINADTVVGRHIIINTRASVDHDCIVGDVVHLAPGSTLCGEVKIGDGTFIGAGVTVCPGITIGKNVTVGAGATVIRDIPDGETVVGVPARTIQCTNP